MHVDDTAMSSAVPAHAAHATASSVTAMPNTADNPRSDDKKHQQQQQQQHAQHVDNDSDTQTAGAATNSDHNKIKTQGQRDSARLQHIKRNATQQRKVHHKNQEKAAADAGLRETATTLLREHVDAVPPEERDAVLRAANALLSEHGQVLKTSCVTLCFCFVVVVFLFLFFFFSFH